MKRSKPRDKQWTKDEIKAMSKKKAPKFVPNYIFTGAGFAPILWLDLEEAIKLYQ